MILHDDSPMPRRAFEKGGGSNNAAGNAAQTSANTQSGALNQIQQIIASMQGLTGNVSSTVGGTGAGSLMELLGLGSSPAALSGVSGVNAPGAESTAVNSLTPFYQSELTQGGGAGFQQASTNAQSQLQQQFAQSLSSILGNTAPGQNPAAAEQASQNSLLSSSANLGSQLAGQQQGIMQNGAQGLGATAQLAEGFNTGTLTNLLSSLQPILSLISGGNTSALSSLGGVQSTAGSQETSNLNLQNQENSQQQGGWDSIFSGLLGAFGGPIGSGISSLFGGNSGGSSAPGGLGAILTGAA